MTKKKGFINFANFDDFKRNLDILLNSDLNYFSGMINKTELGKIIEKANMKITYEEKAKAFLELIGE